ncbi:MAG TPA: hypothetical protein VFQ68_05110 [Streptosporangiaceae bacterium]|nr:hypothetical protein [Streptosporangiaceae bacterium]
MIEMKGGSRRHLASMARRLLATPAARAGQLTRWLGRSGPRAGPLAVAAFLAAGVLAAAGPLPAASAAAVPPGLGGQDWTAIPASAKVVALTFDARERRRGAADPRHAGEVPRDGDVHAHRELRPGFPGPVQGDRRGGLPDR